MSLPCATLLAVALHALVGHGTASAQRSPSSEQRTSVTHRGGRFSATTTTTTTRSTAVGVLGRTSTTQTRAQLGRYPRPPAGRAGYDPGFQRLERLIRDPRTPPGLRNVYRREGAGAFAELARDLETHGDPAGAAEAWEHAAAWHPGTDEASMSFRSNAWREVARLSNESPTDGADTFRRAGDELEPSNDEWSQMSAATQYQREASLHEAAGNGRARSDALVSAAGALSRAADIASSRARFRSRAGWRSDASELRQRATDHRVVARTLRDEASRGYRALGLSFLAARRAVRNVRAPLPPSALSPDHWSPLPASESAE
jgi:hypothetical protein